MQVIHISPDFSAAATASFDGNTFGSFLRISPRNFFPASKLDMLPPLANPAKSVFATKRMSENPVRPFNAGSSAAEKESGAVLIFSVL